MATQTAYDQLTQAQATAKANMDAAQKAYTDAQTAVSNDATYVYYKQRINSIDAAANANGGTALSSGKGKTLIIMAVMIFGKMQT